MRTTTESKRSKPCLNMEIQLDRISNLPSDLMERILSRLTIREAMRTSVLSRQWRHRPAMLSRLVFDHNTTARMIDHVLLSHIGPIYKFDLSQGSIKSSDIDRWILHLSRNSIKKLGLSIWDHEQLYKIPSCFFSCQNLIRVELSRCFLKPPPTFKGFRHLKSLEIDYVEMAQDVFENLIICCPLLEKLSMMGCTGFTRLKIAAPNLQSLEIGGLFEELTLVNTLNLVFASIDFNFNGNQRQSPGSSSNLLNLFVHLPRIQVFQVRSYYTMKYLSVGILPGLKLPTPCLYLRYISMYLCFPDVGQILTALCLLRSCPALEELQMFSGHDHRGYSRIGNMDPNPWLQDNGSSSLNQLRQVEMRVISHSCVQAELDFIKFLLLNSPVLETMTVYGYNRFESLSNYKKDDSVDDLAELREKLLQFKRASVDSKVICI